MVQAPRDLDDLARHGGTIRAECRACGRVALFSPLELAMHYRARRWDGRWTQFALRLKCQCGTRNPKVAWLVTDPPPPDSAAPPPRPRFARSGVPAKPTGVDQTEWDRAVSERERRRLIRNARG